MERLMDKGMDGEDKCTKGWIEKKGKIDGGTNWQYCSLD